MCSHIHLNEINTRSIFSFFDFCVRSHLGNNNNSNDEDDDPNQERLVSAFRNDWSKKKGRRKTETRQDWHATIR